MPMVRPTPQQLRARIEAEFDVLFNGADPRQRRSAEGVLARVLALVSHEMLGAIEWASKQVHIATAGKEELPARAAFWGITANPATVASGQVVFLGNPGAVVLMGTELRRADGMRYRTTAGCTIDAGGTGPADVVAVVAGSAGNAVFSTILSLIEPVANVQNAASVGVFGIGGGADIEELESVRARAAKRVQEPPHGGAAHDYEAWVQEVVGRTKVWVKPLMPSVGSVTVFFVMPDGSIPDAPTVALVQAMVETNRPVTASSVTVLAPVADLVPFTIALSPDTLANRQAVAGELADLLLREAEPGGTTPASRIGAAISAATGEYSHVVSSPAGSIVSAAGHIARLGAISWL
ncbi:baseplate J/gp47 family protein [Humitalea sp. 24SJ18S-53]|uniref:baseplate J/gp47 family protein n=1 Tax=Humitalea sp. 24SJ18S-53 TaxID=3422307 RepID=UPI003D66C19A